jgi:hypothetical protein
VERSDVGRQIPLIGKTYRLSGGSFYILRRQAPIAICGTGRRDCVTNIRSRQVSFIICNYLHPRVLFSTRRWSASRRIQATSATRTASKKMYSQPNDVPQPPASLNDNPKDSLSDSHNDNDSPKTPNDRNTLTIPLARHQTSTKKSSRPLPHLVRSARLGLLSLKMKTAVHPRLSHIVIPILPLLGLSRSA